MHELGELEKRHEDFARRELRIIAVSNDDHEAAKLTQARFPHLTIVADTDQNLAKAMRVVHAGAGPGLTDTNAPTTYLIDGAGTIRWLFRPTDIISRLTPDELLSAINETFPRETERNLPDT